MGSIFLYRRSGASEDSDNITVRYEIDNIDSLSVQLNQPASAMPLPMEASDEVILIKMEGNTENISLTWKIRSTGSESFLRQRAGDVTASQAEDDANYEVTGNLVERVDNITVTDGGSGYTSDPTVTISGGNGSGATATPSIVGGILKQVFVTNGGTGYTSTPTVTISSGGGSGATAEAQINKIDWTVVDPIAGENTANKVVGYLLNSIQGKDISDKYWIVIPDHGIKEGWVNGFTYSVSGGSPVVWQGQLQLTVGRVISAYDGDAASEPRNLSADPVDSQGRAAGESGAADPFADTGETIRIRWQAPSDSATDITSYKIYRKDGGHPFIQIAEVGLTMGSVSTNTNYFEYEDDATVGQQYWYYVKAVNGGGNSMKSSEDTAVMP